MKLYLVRHGHAAAGVEDLDPGLDEMGRAQAATAARALARLEPRRLVVSPMRRTRETAEPIARAVGIEPEVRVEVSEVFRPDTAPAERRQMIVPFMQSRWGAQAGDLQDWRARVLAALVELGTSSPGDVVVVSHYIAIGVAIGEALGDDRVVPTEIANASITTLEAEDGALVLLHGPSVVHLAPEQVTGLHTAILGTR